MSNKCESWNICPLGDITKYLGCRKAWCPKKTMADVHLSDIAIMKLEV